MIWVWLWTVSACEGGDISAIVAKAKRFGVGVMVKTSDGLTDVPNGMRGYQLVSALRAAGVPVRAWGYVYPGVDPEGQAEKAVAAIAAGAQGYVLDAEAEWKGHPDEAKALVRALRARAMPQLGYSPLPIIEYHTDLPYIELNALDVVLPQAYAGTGGRGAADAFAWSEDNWRRWGATWREGGFPVPPIEWAVYAADQSPEDLRIALQLALDPARLGNGDASVWSWQHMTDAHWAVVAEFKEPDPASAAAAMDAAAPEYAYQSADPAPIKVGEVVQLVGVWDYADGARRSRGFKMFTHRAGRFVVELYPLASDDTTEHRDATPARWCVVMVS